MIIHAASGSDGKANGMRAADHARKASPPLPSLPFLGEGRPPPMRDNSSLKDYIQSAWF